jgi:hypothetical protein
MTIFEVSLAIVAYSSVSLALRKIITTIRPHMVSNVLLGVLFVIKYIISFPLLFSIIQVSPATTTISQEVTSTCARTVELAYRWNYTTDAHYSITP